MKSKIAIVLKKLRLDAGLGQREFEKEAGFAHSHVCAIENERRCAGLTTLEKYADYFNIKISDIIIKAEELK